MRILLADDHAILRSGLQRILTEEFPEVEIGEAATCAQVLTQIQRKSWDVCILDISMGAQNSLTLLPEIKKTCPKMPVIMLSMYKDRQFVVRALQGGASAYVSKERAPEELLHAIRAVREGRRYLGESIAAEIADHLALVGSENPHETLSPREYEIFLLLAAARSVSEIAGELNLSVKTVSTYRARILEKMGLRSNAEVMKYALRHGLSE
jgi:DNA-binding NarL/FixJ family response regulator